MSKRTITSARRLQQQWTHFFPDFWTQLQSGGIRRLVVKDGSFEYTLVLGAYDGEPRSAGMTLLDLHGHLAIYARPNNPRYFGQSIVSPVDSLAFYDSIPADPTFPDGPVRPRRSAVNALDLTRLFELAIEWNWNIGMSTPRGGSKYTDVHAQFYCREHLGIPSFPLIENSLKRPTPANICALPDGLNIYDLKEHPCPTLLLTADLPFRDDRLAKVVSGLCFAYAGDGSTFNLFIRATDKSGSRTLECVFIPRRLEAIERMEYPVDEIDQMTGDWLFGLPELAGGMHVRGDIDVVARRLSDKPQLLTESLQKVGGDIERVKAILRQIL
jgi:hypothetical protein